MNVRIEITGWNSDGESVKDEIVVARGPHEDRAISLMRERSDIVEIGDFRVIPTSQPVWREF